MKSLTDTRSGGRENVPLVSIRAQFRETPQAQTGDF